jgi:hypothetical protein
MAEIMIRIERGEEVDGPGPKAGRRHGVFAYHAPLYPLVCGYSRQPLLDACRQLKSLYGLTGERAGLFREGSEIADISCPIEAGAATTVKERDKGSVKFEAYVDLTKVFDRPANGARKLSDSPEAVLSAGSAKLSNKTGHSNAPVFGPTTSLEAT